MAGADAQAGGQPPENGLRDGAVVRLAPAGQAEDLRAAITSARAAVEHLCAIELFAWETLL